MKLDKQISVITANKPGVLYDIAEALGSANVNIDAIVGEGLAETGVVRIITKDVSKAKKILEDRKFMVVEVDVIKVEIPNKPGEMMKIASRLAQKKVDINFIYQFVSDSNATATVVIKPDNIEKAIKALENI